MKALIPILALLTLVACEPRDEHGRTKAEREAYARRLSDSLFVAWSVDSAALATSDAWMDSVKATIKHAE